MKKIILYFSFFIILIVFTSCTAAYYGCDCKLTSISPCFCKRPSPESLTLSTNKAIPFKKDETCVTISESRSFHYPGNPIPSGECGFYIVTEKIKQKSVEYKKKLTLKIPGIYKFVNMQESIIACKIAFSKPSDAKFARAELIRHEQRLGIKQVSTEDVVELELSIPAVKTDNDFDVIANIEIETSVFYGYSSSRCNAIH